MSGRSGYLWRNDKEVEREDGDSLDDPFDLQMKAGQRVIKLNSLTTKTWQMLRARLLLLFDKSYIGLFTHLTTQVHIHYASLNYTLCLQPLKTNANQAIESCSGANESAAKDSSAFSSFCTVGRPLTDCWQTHWVQFPEKSPFFKREGERERERERETERAREKAEGRNKSSHVQPRHLCAHMGAFNIPCPIHLARLNTIERDRWGERGKRVQSYCRC